MKPVFFFYCNHERASFVSVSLFECAFFTFTAVILLYVCVNNRIDGVLLEDRYTHKQARAHQAFISFECRTLNSYILMLDVLASFIRCLLEKGFVRFLFCFYRSVCKAQVQHGGSE